MTDDSRNAEGKPLADVERELHALTGGPPSEEERARWALERRAEEEGDLCGACGRALDEGEPVYRITVFNGKSFGGGYSRRVVPRCKGCVDAYDHRPVSGLAQDERWVFALAQVRKRAPKALVRGPLDRPRPCEVCARPVVNERSLRLRAYILCSGRCTKTYWTEYRRDQRAGAAAELRHKPCAVCGEVFDAPRRDAVTCSPACRQKAYRTRVREG